MYERLANENENQYIARVCSMKDQMDWTWQDIANILNEHLGYDYGESCYRKKFQMFNSMLHDNSELLFKDDKYLNQINAEKVALECERYKLNATKVEMSRLLRQQSRFELFYENVRNAIQPLPPPDDIGIDSTCNRGNKEYVLAIADLQCGANFNLPSNVYSIDECRRRFGCLANQISQYINDNGIMKLHIVELGDTVQGMLRISDIQLNESSVVEATVAAARMIADFLNKISDYCYIEYYHVPTSNHAQTRPLGTKASEMASEDVEYVIGNYIKDVLALNSRINVHLNFGQDYIWIPIHNFNVLAMHGHTIKNLESCLSDLSATHRVLLDYVIIGHYHNGRVVPGNEHESHDTELLMCPSFQGTDPYAYNKLGKSSKAACKIFVFDEKHGCTGTEKFILN
mgnify:CR=1 FL=1